MDALSKLITFLREMSLGFLFLAAAMALLVVSPITLTCKCVKRAFSKHRKGDVDDSFYC